MVSSAWSNNACVFFSDCYPVQARSARGTIGYESERGGVEVRKILQLGSRHTEKMARSVQLLSRVRFFATRWTAARQASLSITNSQSLLKLMSIKSVMPSNHLILCHPLLLLPSVFARVRVFSSASVLCIRWPKYWSFSFIISLFNEYSELMVG